MVATTLSPTIHDKNVNDITLLKSFLSSKIDTINQLSFEITRSYLNVRPEDQESFNVVIIF